MNKELPAINTMQAASYAYKLADLQANNQWNAAMAGDQVMTFATPVPSKEKTSMAVNKRRLVKVLIVDPDENVPLTDALLHSGKEQFTDLTDQELFFEIDIQTILKTHNEKRAKLINKAVKERQEFLEPARIRDLKMVVVEVAGF